VCAVADPSSSTPTLSVIDVATGTPVVDATRTVPTAVDIAWSRDGTHVLATAGGSHASYLAADLSGDGAYSGVEHWYPNAVAAGPGGDVAAGLLGPYGDDIRIYHADGTRLYRFDFARASASSWLANHGLAYAADGTLFAVTNDGSFTAFRLRVIRNPPVAPTSIGLTPPWTKTVGKALSIQGQVATYLELPENTPITVQKQGLYGTVDLPTVYTRAGGAFTITDTPTKREQVTYTATFAGDAHHTASTKSVSFQVKGIVPPMTISTSSSVYDYGQVFPVTVHLGRPPGALVNVYAQPYGGAKVLIRQAPTDSNGNVLMTYSVTKRTTLTASFAGDETYEPAGATRNLTARARLISSLSGYYGTSGSYRLFKTYVDPVFRLTVQPSNPGALLAFTVETYYPPTRSWVRKAGTNWGPTLDAYSKASYKYVSAEPANVRFRIRASFQHTTLNYDTTGPWVYGMFTA
jgi:hypothetical protein